MAFDLINPWDEWKVWTKVGKRLIATKLDTGAPLTLIGVDNARLLGLDLNFTQQQVCIRFYGVSGKLGGHAFKVSCASLPFGSEKLICSFVYVPFEYAVAGKKVRHKFITPDKYLIGTDVLNNYNMRASFDKAMFSSKVKSVELELTPHGLQFPAVDAKEDTFANWASKIDEVLLEPEENVLSDME